VAAASTHDYAQAVTLLAALPAEGLSPKSRTVYMTALKALASGDARAKADAATALVGSGFTPFNARTKITLLGALGANAQALKAAIDNGSLTASRQALMTPALAGARADPGFAAAADALGLTRYWKTTGIKPDFCRAADAPAYCKTI